jgi:uncharacterized protein YkwD
MHDTARLPVPRRRPGAAVLACLLAAGCAGAAQRPGAAGPAAEKAAAGGPAASPAAAPRGQFAPSKAPAAAYGAPGGRCPTGGVFRAVLDELEAAARKSGRQAPIADGAVCEVAETFLRWDQSAGPPRPQVLAFVSQWFGLPASVLPPSIAVIETEDVKIMSERIVQAIGNTVLNAVQPRLGIASLRVKRDATKVAVVLLDTPVEISPPFPRRLEAGQKATLSGRLLAGLASPRVIVSDATGQMIEPEQAAGTEFKAEVTCGDKPGRILVDVRGTLDGRSGIVASFPVGCGSDLPASIAAAPEPWPSEAREAEKRILELVNQERASAGLPSLVWDEGLAGVARGISEDLASKGGTGGVDVGERLRREGIGTPLVLQSAAAERTFERAHDRLVSSPGNRANIMNREVTSLGVGAVAKTDAQGSPMIYVTEVFIKQLPPVDVTKTRQALRAAVAQKRKDARTSALQPDGALDETAQQYAEALAAAAGTLPKEKHAELTAPLNKGFKAVTMVSGAKQEPLDFAEEPQVTAQGRSLGVGVAQGRHAELGRNAVYVVIMVGTSRSEAVAPSRSHTAPGAKPAPKAGAKPGR